MSSCLKSLVSTPGRGTRIPPRLGRASCCQWWSVTEPGEGHTQPGRMSWCHGILPAPPSLRTRKPPPPLTFQGLHDLQLVRQVGEGAEGEAGASGELRAPRVGGPSRDDALVGGEEAAGALPIPQPPKLALPLRLKEGALLRGMALLPHRQPLHRRLQVLPARGCPGLLSGPFAPAGRHSIRVLGPRSHTTHPPTLHWTPAGGELRLRLPSPCPRLAALINAPMWSTSC